MHLKRTEASHLLPIRRKGTKYIARALNHSNKGIPVVIALRDVLKVARTAKEVQKMVNDKLIKINGKEVKNIRESVKMFNILEAGKSYVLIVSKNGRFRFDDTKGNLRSIKLIGKKVLRGGKLQLNFHDGTNILINKKDKISIGDSVVLENNKIKKINPIEKGAEAIVISGKSIGLLGKVKEIKEGRKVRIFFDESGKEVELDASHIFIR